MNRDQGQVANTRQMGACLRCRNQRIRVSNANSSVSRSRSPHHIFFRGIALLSSLTCTQRQMGCRLPRRRSAESPLILLIV